MSSTTPNIGLTKVASSETIGDLQTAMNGSGGNMDIIDTKMGPVGNTSLQAQVNTLSSQKVTGKQFAIVGGNSITFTMTNSSRITLICSSAYNSHTGIINLTCSNSGVADYYVMLGATGLSISTSGNTVTISATNGVNGTAIIHAGSLS